MTWPDPSDYQDAVQNPRTCFQDPELRAGSVALTPLGLPRVASGNFASVYEVRNGAQRWAVRCFLRQVSDQQRRYALLSQRLLGLWLPSLVGFEYLPQGIRVRGQWYPIVKMLWVDGEALHTFVERHLNNTQTLLNLAAQWRGLVNGLRGSHLAHGDLQHGNVLVTPQGIMLLVDYDAMFVPPLRGMQSPELGHPNFQHPKRTPDDYNEGLDNFAAMVIYMSLRALAADPGLWQQFHTGENLILSAADYKAPQQSAVFQRLKRSGDAGVRELAAQLEQCCGGSVAQVPEFETVVAALSNAPQHVSVSTAPAATPSTISPSAPSAAPPSPTVPWWQTTSTQPQPQPPAPPARTQPQPTRPTTPPRPRNLWAWAALVYALLAFVPALRLWAGLAAVVCGVVGWRRARPLAGRGRWMAGSAFGVGGVMALMVLMPVVASWVGRGRRSVPRERASPTTSPTTSPQTVGNGRRSVPGGTLQRASPTTSPTLNPAKPPANAKRGDTWTNPQYCKNIFSVGR